MSFYVCQGGVSVSLFFFFLMMRRIIEENIREGSQNLKIRRKGRYQTEECPSVDEREKPPHPSEQINLSEEKRHLL